MDKFFFKKIIVYFGIVLIIFLADRISKLYILSVLENSGDVDIYINSYINLILAWNSGIGFGLLSFDKSVIYNTITILIIFINLIILYLIIKSDKIRSYLFVIILGGSIGNLFDRIYYSAVPDFIDISYKGYHWFIFNVADIFISIGIICLIIVELMNYKKSDEN
jgi:signal peptidase II